MKSIKEKSKEWCNNHSNKCCTEQCDGCWQVKSDFGCEQYNMELAYDAGANYVLEQIEHYLNNPKEEFIKMFPNSPLGASHATLKQVIKELKGE